MKKRSTKKKVRKAVSRRRSAWRKEDSISKDELKRLVQSKVIEHIAVEQNSSNDYWLNVVEKDELRPKYLATRRKPDAPRLFRHMDVITRFLRKEIGMNGKWVLILNTKVNG